MQKALLFAAIVAGIWFWNENQVPNALVPVADLPAQSVVLFATKTCPQCQKARDYFAQKGIEYLEYLVDDSELARIEFDKLSRRRGVPMIYYEGQTQLGFSAKRLDSMLANIR